MERRRVDVREYIREATYGTETSGCARIPNYCDIKWMWFHADRGKL